MRDERYEMYNYVLILGAGVKKDGTPSRVLEDRLKCACDLQKNSPHQLIYVVSGGNGAYGISEAEVMKSYLETQGNVPSEYIIVDKKGYNTRRSIDNLVKQHIDHVILVTNAYHMPRTAYLAHKAGLSYSCVFSTDGAYFQYWAICRREHVAWVKELLIATKDSVSHGIKAVMRYCLPKKILKSIQYILVVKRIPHPINPKTFSEKISFGCISDSFENYAPYADKAMVRNYVIDTIGDMHIIPAYGVIDNIEDFEQLNLSEKVFVKPTNSTNRYFAYDPQIMSVKPYAKQFLQWKSEDYTAFSLERQYKKIPFGIIVEKDISDRNPDYKVLRAFCFKGKIEFFYINDMKGNSWQLTKSLEELPFQIFRKHQNEGFTAPCYWNEMYADIERLAEKFEFVRVDMYLCDKTYYFSELTFSPHGGVMKIKPKQYDMYLGGLFAVSDTVNKV